MKIPADTTLAKMWFNQNKDLSNEEMTDLFIRLGLIADSKHAMSNMLRYRKGRRQPTHNSAMWHFMAPQVMSELWTEEEQKTIRQLFQFMGV